jgi:EAL domain-containing protein (putative c-di-GMP-specific phosphodiesterase class I)
MLPEQTAMIMVLFHLICVCFGSKNNRAILLSSNSSVSPFNIINISRWVFLQACRLIRDAKLKVPDTQLATNISGRDTIHPDFQHDLLQWMKFMLFRPAL